MNIKILFTTLFLLTANCYGESILHVTHSFGNYRFLAVSSLEVERHIGLVESSKDAKFITSLIYQRANHICHVKGLELLDFDIRDSSSEQELIVYDSYKEILVRDDYRFSFKDISTKAIGFILTGGVETLLEGQFTSMVLEMSVQASTSYLTHYLSEKLSDLELKGFISYKHAFFKRVSCFNSENQSESDLNDLKMNYFCPKSEIIKDYCSEIQTVDEMICIESAMNKGLDFYESKDSCHLNKVN